MSNEIYFKSSNVTVYPCAYRGANDEVIQFNQKSRLITEEGLTTTGSSGDLARSYIVSYADNCLKAVIKGYYFEIKNIKDQFNYLNIKLKQIESGDEYQTVLSSIIDESENVLDVKQGDDYIFTGIVGSSEAITGCDYLKVFDDNYEIVKTSYLPSYDDELGALHTANNEANATNATAFGNNNKASTSDGQFAVGRFNNDDGSLFSVGNGTSDSKRSNVFSTGSAKGTKINENTAINGTLTISGNTTISGKLDVKKSLELTDTLTVGKETTLQDKLIVEKNGAEISGDSKITGNLTSTGALSGLTLDIASTADISGDVAAKSNVTINGSVNINKTNDDFTNKINEDGITTAAIKADSIQLTKNVENTIAGKVVINNDLEVTGTENVDKVMATDLNATNSLNVTFNKEYITTINKNGISTKTVAATGDITSDGVLTVKGATNSAFSGSITAKSGKTDYNNNKNNHVALLSDLLDLLYPVGAIYVMDAYTFNSTEMIQSDSDLICPLEKKLGGT